MIYDKLKEFDNNKADAELIKSVRKLLYDFSYSNLSIIYKNKAECQKVRKSIINYLYTGSFKLQDDIDLDKKVEELLKKAIFKDYNKAIDNLNKIEVKTKAVRDEIKKIKELKENAESGFDFNRHFFDAYFKIWEKINSAHKTFIKSLKLVNYLLVYEAPPFSKVLPRKYIAEKYFLTSNKGNYAGSIKSCFDSESDVTTILKEKNVAYFDLVMGCLPIADEKKFDLRQEWCYEEKFKLGGKALPIVLLELGISYILTNTRGPIIKFPKIAIGTPVKTSKAIFEYYTDNPMKVFILNNKLNDFLDFKKRKKLNIHDFIFLSDQSPHELKNFTEILSIDISEPNSINGFKKHKEHVFLPLHKANIISVANSPNGELLKNAFDNY